MNGLTWIGILLCLCQSAMLSGLNLGLFSLSRLELQVEAKRGSRRAQRVLAVREDAHFALVTILWANVGVNVLLAVLSGSLLSGVMAFLFSTVVITVFAEILPQAYFTRHALRLASALVPILRAYQFLLYPLARASAWALDAWLGGEEIRYFRERDLRRLIQLHMEASPTDIGVMEGRGAMNFLDLDDVPLHEEGEAVDPKSVLSMEFAGGRPVFPRIGPTGEDAFLAKVNRSGKSWVVIVDAQGEPRLVLSANDFVREAMFDAERFNPYRHCHRPILVKDPSARLGALIQRFTVRSHHAEDDIVEHDVILLWSDRPRVITGTDILGRLLRGIAQTPTQGSTLQRQGKQGVPSGGSPSGSR